MSDFTSIQLSGTVGLLIDFWFNAFKRNKWLTVIATIIFFVSFGYFVYYMDQKDRREIEKAKIENLDLNKRITELEEVEKSLKNLIVFVNNQKQSIVITENNIKELEKKKNELEPIVKSQQETVEALFQEQDKRNYERRWIERFIGFGLGIAASIIVSIVFGILARIKLKSKTNNND